MYPTDSTAFNALLNRCADVFAKDLNDGTRTAYWEALRDLPLAQIEQLAQSHVRYGKFFPKPFELRPKQEKPVVTDPGWAERKREYDRRACETLDELCRDNPLEWLESVGSLIYRKAEERGMSRAQADEKISAYIARHASQHSGQKRSESP